MANLSAEPPSQRPPLARVRPLDHPPGRLELLRLILRNPIEAWPGVLYKWPILRQKGFGPERVFLMDPALIQQVLLDDSDAFHKSDSMRRALVPALGEAILTADGERWRWQRRAAAPVFRPDRVEAFLPAMLRAATETRDRWLALPTGTEIDLAHDMMRTTFDIIVATMLSGEGDLDVAEVERGFSRYLNSTSWAVALSLLRAPNWVPYPGRRRAMQAAGYLARAVRNLVASRRAADSCADDLLGLLLRTADPDSGRVMDDRDIADNLLTFIAAGHETTALALTWTLYCLSLHPDIEARVLAELDDVTGGAAPSARQLDRLTYLRQVLLESLRLYPPAAVVTRTAQREIRLGESRIVAGTSVFIPTYVVHRHHALWENPDLFDPDRFSTEQMKARHRFAYLPFSGGSRVCIGMGFSLLEATAILAVLLPSVRLRLSEGFTPTLRMRITLRPGTGMRMRVARREGAG